MTRCKTYRLLGCCLSAVALVLCSFSQAALADGRPAQEVRPIVLILLDTSGSMEYDVLGPPLETDDEDVLSVPPCQEGNYGKSRFIVALEVLTGSFLPGTYWCGYDDRTLPEGREDQGYPVPHVVPHGVQADDGLLDVSKGTFKFGVMTFDAVSGDGAGPEGGYSYGPEEGTNLGARNENAATGPFVEPYPREDADGVEERNRQVEESILSVVPFSGTPLAPMLSDALYYFQHDPDVLPFDPDKKTGDKYYACRSRNIVLITDGRASLGEGTDGYLTSVEYAFKLLQAGVKVYVVGFKVPQGVQTLLDQIAAAGGTSSAYIATEASELVQVLRTILGNISTAVQSRATVAATSDTGNQKDLQYQVNAAYGTVDDQPGLLRGYLELSVYRCKRGNRAELSSVRYLHKVLNDTLDTQRKVYTVVNGQRKEFVASELSLQDLGFPEPVQPGEVLAVDPSPSPGSSYCGAKEVDLYSQEARANYIAHLVEYVRGAPGSCREKYKLGAIVHSTPAVQDHLKDVQVKMASFETYRNSDAFKNRPTVVYLGTGDGMIHAFKVDRADSESTVNWGTELWAFIPEHLLKKLKDLPTEHRPLMDGSPVVKDVLLTRSLQTLREPQKEADNWRSVLVTGYRGGGRGYIALDVTRSSEQDARYPVFMWEISPEKRCFKADAASAPQCFDSGYTNDFTKLGFTYSKPAIGRIFTGTEEVAVAVFGAGSSQGLANPGQAGKAAFVVRLDTGEKVAEFSSEQGNVVDPCGVGGTQEPAADLIGDVACYSTEPDAFLTRCFLGDSAGRLWRVELGGAGTSEWRLQLFYDPYYSVSPFPALSSPLRAPIFNAPAMALRPYTNELVVVFGGGNLDKIDDVTSVGFVASLTETNKPPSEPRATPPYQEKENCGSTKYRTAKLNWKVFLGTNEFLQPVTRADEAAGEVLEGEKLMGSPVIFSETVYFTTFLLDAANGCNPGVGSLWGVHYYKHRDDFADPQPRLDQDGDASTPDDLVQKVRIGGAVGHSIPYGLMVVPRPPCFSGQSAYHANPPSSCENCESLLQRETTAPQLVVHVGVQEAATSDTIAPGGVGEEVPPVAKMTRTILNVFKSILVSSWGVIFD